MAGKIQILNTKEEVKALEIIDENVSEKYVPIYTSEIIEHLEPEFSFKYGVKYYNFNSAHSVYLDYKGATISIENSYDRSRAFSFKYNDNGFIIPLNLNRKLHIGEQAKIIVDNISVNKDELIDAIENAKSAVEKLKHTPVRDDFKIAVRDIVFKQPMSKDNFVELVDWNVSEIYKNVYDYTNAMIKKYEEGDYFVKLKSKKTGNIELKAGRKSSSAFLKLQMTNAIYKYIKEAFPEVFI